MAGSTRTSAESRHYDYAQLIEFVRPAHDNHQVWNLQPASDPPVSITGDEARSFYEDLCAHSNDKSASLNGDRSASHSESSASQSDRSTSHGGRASCPSAKSKRRQSSRHQENSAKGLCLGENCRADAEATPQHGAEKTTSHSHTATIDGELGRALGKAGTSVVSMSVSSTGRRDSCERTLRSESEQQQRRKRDCNQQQQHHRVRRDCDRDSGAGGVNSGQQQPHHRGKDSGSKRDEERADRWGSHGWKRDRTQSELFRLAQHGDAEGLRALLSNKGAVDVNCRDQFGWTAAMCAAFEGHLAVVQTLVSSGADLSVTNAQGLTALALALNKGHRSLAGFIQSTLRRASQSGLRSAAGVEDSTEKKEKERTTTRFFCKVCKSEFSGEDRAAHERSTVHIFSMGRRPKDDSFLIPPSNVGFRLMLKAGWDGHRGLGPSGLGQKYPVKTFLKKDRKGLGNEGKVQARVTHFKPHERSAVERKKTSGSSTKRRALSARIQARRAQRAKERKAVQWEVYLRRQLS